MTDSRIPRRLLIPIAAFPLLILAFFAIARSFGVSAATNFHPIASTLSFSLLFLPYWCFGWGAASPLRARLDRRWKRFAAGSFLLTPWLVSAVIYNAFRLNLFFSSLLTILVFIAVLDWAEHTAPAPTWLDAVALLILAVAVEMPLFRTAWPDPGLSALAKLLFVDLGLFGYLVVRPVGGIGFVFQISRADLKIGLREFFLFAPLALPLGFVFQFLHFHPVMVAPTRFTAAWLFTFFFIAVPEELFFRGLLLNLLERRLGTGRALAVSSVIFGLAHFPKRAVFNWRYVILAAAAGVFYGRAWLANRRLPAAGITHATVDTAWSLWLR